MLRKPGKNDGMSLNFNRDPILDNKKNIFFNQVKECKCLKELDYLCFVCKTLSPWKKVFRQ